MHQVWPAVSTCDWYKNRKICIGLVYEKETLVNYYKEVSNDLQLWIRTCMQHPPLKEQIWNWYRGSWYRGSVWGIRKSKYRKMLQVGQQRIPCNLELWNMYGKIPQIQITKHLLCLCCSQAENKNILPKIWELKYGQRQNEMRSKIVKHVYKGFRLYRLYIKFKLCACGFCLYFVKLLSLNC